MNENQRVIRLLTKHHEENGRNKIFYNIAYNLIKNYDFSKSTKKVDEFAISLLVDNLWINNEIVDKFNINEYDGEYLNKRLGSRTIARINNNENLFLLLNFYDINNNLIQCSKVYKYDYNILEL